MHDYYIPRPGPGAAPFSTLFWQVRAMALRPVYKTSSI
jgi:hypothetical protein